MIGLWKLFRLRKDGSIGSLFINRRRRLPLRKWLRAERHPTKGFAVRPGWHLLEKPKAPHLSKRGRAWRFVWAMGETRYIRPKSQGGVWYTAKWIFIT